jgi:type III pantothenate kinase
VKLLAADIGNTNVTIGLFEDDRLARSWRAITRANATADEVRAMLTSLLALDGHRLDELDAVALASVVPPLTETWERLVTERIGVTPALVDASSLGGRPRRPDRSPDRGRRRPPRQRAGRSHRVRRAGHRHLTSARARTST